MVKLFLPNSGYQSSVKIAKITYRKQFGYIIAGAADSRTKPAFMKFVHANAIESYLTDSQMSWKITKKYHIEKVWSLFQKLVKSKSFLAHSRLFEVVSCCFLLIVWSFQVTSWVVHIFSLFLACGKSFEVVSCSWAVSGCFVF